MYILFILLLSQYCFAFPPCDWVCPATACVSSCKPWCESASCQVCHNDTGTPVCAATQACHVSCPTPVVYHNDSCPECETVCPGTLCDESDPHCFILCEAPECSWKCQGPVNCNPPQCTWQCEQAYCPYSASSSTSISFLFALLLVSYMSL